MMIAMCAGRCSKLTCRASGSSDDPGGMDARSCSSDMTVRVLGRKTLIVRAFWTEPQAGSVVDSDQKEPMRRRGWPRRGAIRRRDHVAHPLGPLAAASDF